MKRERESHTKRETDDVKRFFPLNDALILWLSEKIFD